jgi:hypothetical protein
MYEEHLSTEDIVKVKEMAVKRCNKNPDVKSQLMSKNFDDYGSSVCGIAGELAVSRFLHIKLPEWYNKKGGDNGVDMMYNYKGKKVRIDVKYTTFNPPILMVPVKNKYGKDVRMRADIFVLTCSKKEKKIDDMIIVGWIWTVDFMKQHYLWDWGRGESRNVDAIRLNSPLSLL